MDDIWRTWSVCLSEIRDVELRMEEATREDDAWPELLEEKGVGLVTAVTMRAEIGCFRSFPLRQTIGPLLCRDAEERVQWQAASRRGIDQGRQSLSADGAHRGRSSLGTLCAEVARPEGAHEIKG